MWPRTPCWCCCRFHRPKREVFIYTADDSSHHLRPFLFCSALCSVTRMVWDREEGRHVHFTTLLNASNKSTRCCCCCQSQTRSSSIIIYTHDRRGAAVEAEVIDFQPPTHTDDSLNEWREVATNSCKIQCVLSPLLNDQTDAPASRKLHLLSCHPPDALSWLLPIVVGAALQWLQPHSTLRNPPTYLDRDPKNKRPWHCQPVLIVAFALSQAWPCTNEWMNEWWSSWW